MTVISKPDRTDGWVTRANTAMMRRYCISLEGMGLDDHEVAGFAQAFPDPLDFVEWFAAKYDLTHVADVNFGRRLAQT